MKALRAWLILGRVSNLPTVWTNVLVAWLLSGGAFTWSAALSWMLAGASLLYVGGTTLNDFFDVAFDREFRKERPIPSDVLSRRTVGVGCLLYFVGGIAAILVGAQGSWIFLAGLIVAIVLYDYRHKEWVGSVFVMGGCRFFLSLVAASCVASVIAWPVWIYAVTLFAYIVGLSFTARGESRSQSVIRWPLGLLALPLCGAVWLGVSGLSWPLASACGLFLGAVSMSLRLLKQGDDSARIGKSVALMLATIALADAMFLAAFGAVPAMLGVAVFFMALFFQRMVPAT
ncbi:UbiA family prenyltransferase [bacterium]|nr:UbiA family prenyltransferase [bacterium]MDF1788494.1 UbiA family prenyltransferase [Verrucomicrobiales bacterium]